MNTTPASEYRPSRGDRVGILIFMAAGIAIIIMSAIAAGLRIYEVLLGESIPAMVSLIDTTVEVPIGSSGETIPMTIDSASVTATHLSNVGFVAAIAAAILGFLVITAIVVCLLALAGNTLRGRIFSRGNTRLVITAGMIALVGFGILPVVDGMVGNEILHDLSGGNFTDAALFVAQPQPFILLGFAFGIIATAYTIGARMQRDQEGLV